MSYKNLDGSTLDKDVVQNIDKNLDSVLYKVSVPRMFIVSEAERKEYGTVTDDYGKLMIGMEEAYNKVYWPISRIIEAKEAGANIRIPFGKDILGIYNLIVDYLDIQTAILKSPYRTTYMDKVYIKSIISFYDELKDNVEVKALINEEKEYNLQELAEALNGYNQQLTNISGVSYGELREVTKFASV